MESPWQQILKAGLNEWQQKVNWLPIKNKHSSIIIKIPFSTLGSSIDFLFQLLKIFLILAVHTYAPFKKLQNIILSMMPRVKKCYDNDTLHSIYLSIAVLCSREYLWWNLILRLSAWGGKIFVQLVNFVIVRQQKRTQKNFSTRFYQREIITDLMKIIIIYLLYRA